MLGLSGMWPRDIDVAGCRQRLLGTWARRNKVMVLRRGIALFASGKHDRLGRDASRSVAKADRAAGVRSEFLGTAR